MPDPNLQAYLAAHYLSGPKADAILARTSSSADGKVKRKKKKPKTDSLSASDSSTGLVIKDDSDSWKATDPTELDNDEDGLTPQIVGGAAASGSSSKAFRKIDRSSRAEDAENAEAGPSTPSATGAHEEQKQDDPGPTEFRAGLRTKEEMKAARLAREERRKRESAHQPAPTATTQQEPEENAEQETVYRDNTGRIIDIHALEEEQKALELVKLRKEHERSTTWNQGLVQKQNQQQLESQLSSIRSQNVARRATDSEYNDHFKSLERSDDPALAFLTKKRSNLGVQKPKYKGPFPPNRFNIPPGYRWDGVVRGNGFEKAFFERKSQLANREREARAWGQSDM